VAVVVGARVVGGDAVVGVVVARLVVVEGPLDVGVVAWVLGAVVVLVFGVDDPVWPVVEPLFAVTEVGVVALAGDVDGIVTGVSEGVGTVSPEPSSWATGVGDGTPGTRGIVALGGTWNSCRPYRVMEAKVGAAEVAPNWAVSSRITMPVSAGAAAGTKPAKLEAYTPSL
jgi:hypothetical protein